MHQAVSLHDEAARNAQRLTERAAWTAQQAGMHTFGIHIEEEEDDEGGGQERAAAAAGGDGGGSSSSSGVNAGEGCYLNPKPTVAEVEVLLEQARAAQQVRT